MFDYAYILTPFITWFIAGSLKFILNTIKSEHLAFSQVGYGGMPSNHSAIVSSITALIAFKEGITHPALGVSMAFAFIIILDANSLRQKVGEHAKYINNLNIDEQIKPLRERMGHTKIEILAGIIVGVFTAFIIYQLAQ